MIESVDDAFAAEWAARLDPDSRERLIALLRRWADRIESGVADVDAAILVLSKGDVHHVYARGSYDSDEVMSHAFHALSDYHLASITHTRYDAVKAADGRERNRALRAAEAEAARLAKPFVCICDQRYGSERGLAQHAALAAREARKEYGGSDRMVGVARDDGTISAYVNVETAEEAGWSQVGWCCPLPAPHYLSSVYVGLPGARVD